MSSGVKVTEEIQLKYEHFKMKKRLRFVSLRLVELEDENTGMKTLTFGIEKELMKGQECDGDPLTDLVELIKDNSPRFIFFDYPVLSKTDKTSKKDQLFMIQFIPDSCKIKEKMVYASSAQGVKAICDGSSKYVQLNEWEDLKPELLQEIYNSK